VGVPESRSTWPVALPTAAIAAMIAVPALPDVPAWLDRLSFAATGRPLAPEHAVVLAPVLLIVAYGLLVRRRAAWYAALTVVGLGTLAVVTGDDSPWRLPLLAASIWALWRCRDGFPVHPHHARVRSAIRTGVTIVIVSVLSCVFIGGVSVGAVGHDVVTGLGGTGFGVEHASWLPTALGLFGAVGLLVIIRTLLAPAPAPPPGDDAERRHLTLLVAHPGSDTLAPFALRRDKSYVFSQDGRAAIGYRVLFGVAAAGGDPIGDPDSRDAAVREFLALCLRMGWRPAVLGASADRLGSWPGLRSIGIGDEVVLRTEAFGLDGRHMRNVRQAVRRSHNAGVTTEVLPEAALSPELRGRLLEIASASLGGAAERGFSMNLDELLTGRHPGCLVALAYDRDGEPIAFQRYAASGEGLSLDAMRRAPDAPGGVNERLIVDMVRHARGHGVGAVSLNFAAFRGLLDAADRTPLERLGYRVLHLLDPLIAVESLYLFDRKFRPDYRSRSVIFRSWTDIGWIAAALLTLEFGRVRPRGGRRPTWHPSSPPKAPDPGSRYGPSRPSEIGTRYQARPAFTLTRRPPFASITLRAAGLPSSQTSTGSLTPFARAIGSARASRAVPWPSRRRDGRTAKSRCPHPRPGCRRSDTRPK
jgi:lysylphosphatidylglycerol synthetase-like protein (DUF2156 family)